MCTSLKYVAQLAIATTLISTGCASHRGSSSLDNVTKTSASSQKKSSTPTVRADQSVSAAAQAKKNEAREAQEKSVADAEARARSTAQEAQRKLQEAKKKAEEDAAKAREEAEAKAKAEADALRLAKEEAEKKARQAASMVSVREEKAVVVESKTSNAGQYHVIIGSFKALDNAQKASDIAISQGFLPSVMENTEGMYRVSIFSADEENVARQKLVEILAKYPEYVGIWLLKIK